MKESLRSAKTLLIRAPNWVGDIVMATPFFECVRSNFPGARIVGCVRRYAAGVLADAPWFDEIIACHDKDLGGLRETANAFRRLQPDAAVVLPNSWRAVLSPWLAGVKPIYGYRRRGRGFMLTGGPEPRRDAQGSVVPRPMVDYYLDLARWLELTIPENPRPKLYMSDETARDGERRLASYGISPGDLVVGLNPGAKFGSSKCWPAEHFAGLAELLQEEYPCKLLLLVGPGEEALAEAIVAKSRARLVNTGPDRIDLSQLKPLVKRCDLLVTNDTGPRHYAVAFGVPAVVVMGPTDPRYTDANLERTVVVRQDLPCAPCHLKVCPLQHECMTRITPSMVLEAARGLLDRKVSA
jgi:heptosyltransferase-2